MVLQLGGCGRVGDCRNNFCGEGPVRVGRGPFLYSWVLFYSWRGCCLPPFSLWAWQRRRPLREHHPGRPCQSSGPESRSTLSDGDRKSTRLNSSHVSISYAVFFLKKKIISK